MVSYQKKCYQPEGCLISTAENREYLSSEAALERAAINGKILEGMAILCDRNLTLTVDLGCMVGYIPKGEALWSFDAGQTKDIAVITRVGKPVCFRVLGIERDERGKPYALLSRRLAQQECVERYLRDLLPGDIIESRVTHMEQFGAFVDVGCGVISLLTIDCISVSRISHPRDRFHVGELIRTVVKTIDRDEGKLYVSHKELLGTWEENIAGFHIGQTVAGIIRSVEDYGIFVELAPNLAGLAEYREHISPGDMAAVYIKSIIPERMKIKLVLVDTARGETPESKQRYFVSERCLHLDRWQYSPQGCLKTVESVFSPQAVIV